MRKNSGLINRFYRFKSEHGQVAIMFIVLFGLVLLFTTIIIDLNQFVEHKTSMDVAVDNAALALGSSVTSHAKQLSDQAVKGKDEYSESESWGLASFFGFVIGIALSWCTGGWSLYLSALSVMYYGYEALTIRAKLEAQSDALELLNSEETGYRESALSMVFSGVVDDPVLVQDIHDDNRNGETGDWIRRLQVYVAKRIREVIIGEEGHDLDPLIEKLRNELLGLRSIVIGAIEDFSTDLWNLFESGVIENPADSKFASGNPMDIDEDLYDMGKDSYYDSDELRDTIDEAESPGYCNSDCCATPYGLIRSDTLNRLADDPGYEVEGDPLFTPVVTIKGHNYTIPIWQEGDPCPEGKDYTGYSDRPWVYESPCQISQVVYSMFYADGFASTPEESGKWEGGTAKAPSENHILHYLHYVAPENTKVSYPCEKGTCSEFHVFDEKTLVESEDERRLWAMYIADEVVPEEGSVGPDYNAELDGDWYFASVADFLYVYEQMLPTWGPFLEKKSDEDIEPDMEDVQDEIDNLEDNLDNVWYPKLAAKEAEINAHEDDEPTKYKQVCDSGCLDDGGTNDECCHDEITTAWSNWKNKLTELENEKACIEKSIEIREDLLEFLSNGLKPALKSLNDKIEDTAEMIESYYNDFHCIRTDISSYAGQVYSWSPVSSSEQSRLIYVWRTGYGIDEDGKSIPESEDNYYEWHAVEMKIGEIPEIHIEVDEDSGGLFDDAEITVSLEPYAGGEELRVPIESWKIDVPDSIDNWWDFHFSGKLGGNREAFIDSWATTCGGESCGSSSGGMSSTLDAVFGFRGDGFPDGAGLIFEGDSLFNTIHSDLANYGMWAKAQSRTKHCGVAKEHSRWCIDVVGAR